MGGVVMRFMFDNDEAFSFETLRALDDTLR
jgi:hypothetical protein